MSSIEKTKQHFLDTYKQSGETAPYPEHVTSVEKLATDMKKYFPEVDMEVLLLSVWLHDIGALLGDRDIHDINSEIEARRYLAELEIKDEIIEQVAHCVRAHRGNDVMPSTIEAKMLLVVDSASHLIDGPYIDMKKTYGKEYVMGKLDRDYRDLALLPEVKEELTPLYEAWKNLLEILPNKK